MMTYLLVLFICISFASHVPVLLNMSYVVHSSTVVIQSFFVAGLHGQASSEVRGWKNSHGRTL